MITESPIAPTDFDTADKIRAHGLGVDMTDWRSPEPMFFGPPKVVSAEDLDRVAEEQKARQATCLHTKSIFTVREGWHCADCGAPTE